MWISSPEIDLLKLLPEPVKLLVIGVPQIRHMAGQLIAESIHVRRPRTACLSHVTAPLLKFRSRAILPTIVHNSPYQLIPVSLNVGAAVDHNAGDGLSATAPGDGQLLFVDGE